MVGTKQPSKYELKGIKFRVIDTTSPVPETLLRNIRYVIYETLYKNDLEKLLIDKDDFDLNLLLNTTISNILPKIRDELELFFTYMLYEKISINVSFKKFELFEDILNITFEITIRENKTKINLETKLIYKL